jgi:CRISPR-associated protein Csa1
LYFFNPEEKKLLFKGYLPKSREIHIDEDLRGWNWNQPPLAPIYDIKLPMYEIANKYCHTCRDVYLRRVENVKAKQNQEMIMGAVFHDTVAEFVIKTKKLIYLNGIEDHRKALDELKVCDFSVLDKKKEQMTPEQYEDIKDKTGFIWNYEYNQMVSRIQDVLSRQPYINEDSLINLALPVIVEQKLDGSFLGLSKYLSSDAFTMSEPMVVDLKFGKKQEFHRLTTTGYALVMESVFEFPVNVGCIVYGWFKNNRLIIEKDFHIIDDELREWFIEERDERMHMVFEGIDPGIAQECYDSCPYMEDCR